MTEFRWLRLSTPRNGPDEFAESSSPPAAVLVDPVSSTFIIWGMIDARFAIRPRGCGGVPPEYTVRFLTNAATSCEVGPTNFHSPDLDSGSSAASVRRI